MSKFNFIQAVRTKVREHEALLKRRNPPVKSGNGLITRYRFPVVTAAHVPLTWRYDFNSRTNPYFMERLGVGCAFNCGAIAMNKAFLLMVRVEGADRKSFFAVAESRNGVDNFRFWDEPVVMPETNDPDVNVYDMRLVRHQDGWIYGLFCTERPDPSAPEGDTSAAVAACGLARTRDLKKWQRLPDLKSSSPQQRNVVLHPEFINGKYALYTRPQDGFISTGKGGGIGWALCTSMEKAMVREERVIDEKRYHTIKEVKNGLGPAPIKTDQGWLQLAHGVRNTAAGLRYVLYAFLSDLKDPSKIIAAPGGHLMAPRGEERVGDVSNVLFCNGWIPLPDGRIFIYYASSDTRCHVAETSVDKMLDYCLNTPADPMRSYACVQQRLKLIENNRKVLSKRAK